MRSNYHWNDRVHTAGFRYSGAFLGRWDYDFEAPFQFGEYGGVDHSAWALRGKVGYSFDTAWKPRLAWEYRYATGDDDSTPDNEQFDALFPGSHGYLGRMDYFRWENLQSLGWLTKVTPVNGITAMLDVYGFWLDQPTTGFQARTPANGIEPDAFVGTEADLTLKYRLSEYVNLMAGYSAFVSGQYLSDTGENDNANWFYGQVSMNF